MSHQERLAVVLDGLLDFPPLTNEQMAAAILDSDVIREIKAEAWTEGCRSMHYRVPSGFKGMCVPPPNPWRSPGCSTRRTGAYGVGRVVADRPRYRSHESPRWLRLTLADLTGILADSAEYQARRAQGWAARVYREEWRP